MKWSYRIARIAGIDVKIHITFLLLLAYFGVSDWRDGGAYQGVLSMAFILLLFLCVLLHEFGHAMAGRHYGIRTPDITLLPIGGVARMQAIPEKPWQEFVIAVSGPAVNVAIAGGLWVVLFLFPNLLDEAHPVSSEILPNLMTINLALLAFNMIPAFPMDGGRVLRALLAMKLNYLKATKIAARTGQVLAVGFVIVGLGWNPMLIFIGLFVFTAARQELNDVIFREQIERDGVYRI
jgi:stage IV sporulation protein FB